LIPEATDGDEMQITMGKAPATPQKEAYMAELLEVKPLEGRAAVVLRIDQRIKRLFLESGFDYKDKAKEFYTLLQIFIKEALPTGPKERALMAADWLYYTFDSHRSADSYNTYIMQFGRIEDYAPDLAPWVINPEIRWEKVNSLHTLWNLTHQYLLRHEFSGGNARNTLYGEGDEYTKEAINVVLENVPQKIGFDLATSVIVNEGDGRIAVNVRDPGRAGHALSAYLNYKEQMVEVSCLLKREEDIREMQNVLKTYDLTLTHNGDGWLFVAGSSTKFGDILRVLYKFGT
jgi:hypothetical protein